ncbi:MAG: PaaI family thioesterase [Gammaproteobacteria bacterium]|nr:PaaI family thioesterase [Gammaproteobacteria bacterium]
MEDDESLASVPTLNSILDSMAFTRDLGVLVEAVDRGECTSKVPFKPELERLGGIVAGHIYMTAADVAFWLAIATRLGADHSAVTTYLTTSFLQSARQEPVWCTARILRLGRRQAYGVAECHNASGTLFTPHRDIRPLSRQRGQRTVEQARLPAVVTG